MKILIITICLILIPLQSYARESLPDLKFQLENMDENEMLVWCFEVAYRLSDYQSKLKSGKTQPKNEVFCNVSHIDSDLIRGYLNSNHSYEHITDDQALATIFRELTKAYPCTE